MENLMVGPVLPHVFFEFPYLSCKDLYGYSNMGMDQYLLIQFLVGWTSIYQLFWGSPGVQGFDPSPYSFYIPSLLETLAFFEG